MDEHPSNELKAAEEAVIAAEKEHGPNHPELAEKLHKYAELLRQTEKRALDAVNVEARARAIRAKMYAEAETALGDSKQFALTKGIVPKPPVNYFANMGMYVGFAAIFMSLSTLFVNQSFLLILIILSIILAIADVVLTRGGFWRVTIVAVFCISAWWSNQSMPANMLANESPIERFSYGSENREVVELVKTLGKPTLVMSYAICLPPGFRQTFDNITDWGRIVNFQRDAANGSIQPEGQMVLMLIKIPPELRKQKNRPSLLKVARDIAMPQLIDALQLTDVTQENPRFQEVNGFSFAKINYSGRTDQHTQQTGFAYVAVNDRSLLVVAGSDPLTDVNAVLPQMDASIYTLKKQNRGSEPDV